MADKPALTQAVVLAGGRGERLRPLTDQVPKPLVPINGVPFLDYLLASLEAAGIQSVLLLAGYRSDVVVDRYADRSRRHLRIDFSIGGVDDQTGRRVLNAYEKLERHFLLVYGDTYWPLPLRAMEAFYRRSGALMSTTVFSNRFGTAEYGPENNIEVGADGWVRRYDKRRQSVGLNGVDIGYFIVDRAALPIERTDNLSFEEDVLPPLVARRQLGGFVTDEQYYFLTNMHSVARFADVSVQLGIKPIDWNERHGIL